MCATCSKVQYSATRTMFASTRNLLMGRLARICGLTASRKTLANVFKLQDQVVARLANTLGSELIKAEAEKSTHAGNPDAIDLTMRGWAILNEPRWITDNSAVAKALGLFEELALTLDPDNVDALVGAAAARTV